MAPRVSQSITAEFVLKFNEQKKGKGKERNKANNKVMLSNANAKSNSKSIGDEVYYYSYNIIQRLYRIKPTRIV